MPGSLGGTFYQDGPGMFSSTESGFCLDMPGIINSTATDTFCLEVPCTFSGTIDIFYLGIPTIHRNIVKSLLRRHTWHIAGLFYLVVSRTFRSMEGARPSAGVNQCNCKYTS